VTPVPVRTELVDLDGPVRYADYGGEGEPLVLLHGIGGCHLNSMVFAPRLTDRFHVYALDMVGFGLTPLSGRRSSMLNNRKLAGAFVERVARAPATLLGHSMGGAIAMLLAASDPRLVTRLVLVNPAVGKISTTLPPPYWTPVLDAMARLPSTSAGLLRALTRAAAGPAVREGLRRGACDPRLLGAEMVAAHIQLERERSCEADAYLGFLQSWRSMNDVVGDVDDFLATVVARITAPALLLHGATDPIVGREFAARMTGRPGWTVEIIDGIAHAPHMQQPAETALRVLSWVSSPASAATPR
jgi:pimeloyl-ACP methyl ester carboxylesterase